MGGIRRRVLTRLVYAVSAVLVGALAAGGTYAVTVEPGAAVVKAVFEAHPEVTPPADYASIAATVTETRGIRLVTPGSPTARLDIYAPKGSAAGLPVVLWIHGGGFISSSADTVEDYVTMLAARGYVVANLDYTLAPGARHPVPVVQANAALAYLGAHAGDFGGDATKVFLGGDSAGAQIASELGSVLTNGTLAAREGIDPALAADRIRGMVLFCGLYDMSTVGSTGFPALRTYLWAYTGSRSWGDAPGIDDLSTTSTATDAYPPTFLSVGDADPFRTQEAEFASALTAKGVDVTTLTWGGTGDHLGHEYQFDFRTPEATKAFDQTLRFLSTRAAGS